MNARVSQTSTEGGTWGSAQGTHQTANKTSKTCFLPRRSPRTPLQRLGMPSAMTVSKSERSVLGVNHTGTAMEPCVVNSACAKHHLQNALKTVQTSHSAESENPLSIKNLQSHTTGITHSRYYTPRVGYPAEPGQSITPTNTFMGNDAASREQRLKHQCSFHTNTHDQLAESILSAAAKSRLVPPPEGGSLQTNEPLVFNQALSAQGKKYLLKALKCLSMILI